MAVTEHFRTCPLCEATCGLTITMEGDRVVDVRGDEKDVFSHGFICPKGTALKPLHEDPDRLRAPMVRDGDGWREVSWDTAFAAVEAGLAPILQTDRNAVALYIGNPTVHSLSASVMTPALVRTLGSKNFYSAATVDQMPKHVSCGFMFGKPTLIPVPDVDRTDYIVLVGANPWVSNGSLATAPDFPGRLKGVQERGGKVVVVDPRRTETAGKADEHIPIRPGTDALFLLAIANVLFAEGRVKLGSVESFVAGLDEVRSLVEPFTPEAVTPRTGIPADVIVRIARELSDADSASVYDRVGAHQQEFGTLASWAADLVTTITGNLDRPGGKMFATAAHSKPDPDAPGGRGWKTGRFASRVKGYPEAFGQLPIATLSDEIETPGDGKVRALITIAGNPVLSTPNGRRLSGALEKLDFMVAVDPYLNETTRHANVILPPAGILTKHHYDFAFYGLSVRNIANYSPPLVTADGPDEWVILAKLALVFVGQDISGDPATVPQMALAMMVQEACDAGGSLEGIDAAEVFATLEGRGPIEQITDLLLRLGPFGDRFGQEPGGLSLAVLEENPHGVDLGPLVPRLPNALRTKSGKVELAPEEILGDIPRLRESLDREANGMVLIGRRQLRSNNSWMHNVATMVKGSNKCTLLVNPTDAERLGLAQGTTAKIRSRVGEVEAPVDVTDEMMPGVVSLPHGWGHTAPDTKMSVAQAHAGVSSNDLTDEEAIDPLSGNSVMQGIPVTVEAAGV